MNNIPPKMNKTMDADPAYKVCSMYGIMGHTCRGRVTREHTVIFGGKQVQSLWAIIPLCAGGHGVDSFQDDGSVPKEVRVWVALNRATDDELRAISKATDYIRERTRLNLKYGVYCKVVPAEKIPDFWGKSKPEMPTASPSEFQPAKNSWYLVTEKDKLYIERIRQFNKRVEGSQGQREIIGESIKNMYEGISAIVAVTDPQMFKELGFDKEI